MFIGLELLALLSLVPRKEVFLSLPVKSPSLLCLMASFLGSSSCGLVASSLWGVVVSFLYGFRIFIFWFLGAFSLVSLSFKHLA